jgi:glutamine synthetase
MLPGNLLEATQALERDDVLRVALGKCANEDYVDYYARIKRGEWETAHAQVTEWEVDRYLQLF